jgi:hypothetical protein
MLSTLILCLCLAVNAPVANDGLSFATPVGEDSTFFHSAEKLYRAGDYEMAFENFAKAWELSHNPAYAYDAALSLWRCDEPFKARLWLRRVPDVQPGYGPLSHKIIEAINEDDAAWGYEFRCDEKTKYCGAGTGWPKLQLKRQKSPSR